MTTRSLSNARTALTATSIAWPAVAAPGGSGVTTLSSANSGNSSFAVSLPAASGTLALLSQADVASVTNSDGSLTMAPSNGQGSVVASLNVGHANTWTGQQTLSGGLVCNTINPTSIASTIGATTPYTQVNALNHIVQNVYGGYTALGTADQSTQNTYAIDLPATNGNVVVDDGTGSGSSAGKITANSLAVSGAANFTSTTSAVTFSGPVVVQTPGGGSIEGALVCGDSSTGQLSPVTIANGNGCNGSFSSKQLVLTMSQNLGTAGSVQFATVTANQLTLQNSASQLKFQPGGSGNQFTISCTNPSANRTITLPDPGAAAHLVLDQGNYTIAGTWTFTPAVTMTGGAVIPYGVNSSLVGASSDLNGHSFALAVGAPNGTSTWPFGIITGGGASGVTAFAVSNANKVETNNNVLDSGSGGMTVAGQLALQASSSTGQLMIQPGGSGSSCTYSQASITLTQSQIVNLYTTPVQVLAAPGANSVIVPAWAGPVWNYVGATGSGAVAFGGGGPVQLQYANTAGSSGGGVNLYTNINAAMLTTSTANQVAWSTPFGGPHAASSTFVNQPIYVTNLTAAFTGGTGGTTNGSLSVTFPYMVITGLS